MIFMKRIICIKEKENEIYYPLSSFGCVISRFKSICNKLTIQKNEDISNSEIYFAPSIAYIMEKIQKLELTLKQAYKVKSN